MDIEFKYIDSDSKLEEIRCDWKKLDQESQHHQICSTYEWVYNWWGVFKSIDNNIYGYQKRLFIICGYYDDKLVFILPLMKLYRKVLGLSFSFVEFIGQQWSGVYYDAIIDVRYKISYEIVLKYLLDTLKFDILYLRYLPKTSFINEKEKMFKFTCCPEINLKDYLNYDEYAKTNYSKGHKQNLRTGKNRASKNKDNLEETVETITDSNFNSIIHISKTKMIDKKTSVYQDIHKQEFYKRLYNCFNSNVIFIKINQQNVAYRTNLIFNNMKLCLDASFDRTAPKYELGILSVNKNIKDSYAMRLDIHSLGPGLDAYKIKFIKSFNQLYFVCRKGNTFRSYFITSLFIIMMKNK